MAEIVAAVGTTHTPGLLGWFGNAPQDQQHAAIAAFGQLREHLHAARPDVMIVFANDHLLNWPINNTPEYTVGVGDLHVGPADWYDEWLARAEKYRVPGRSALARHIVNDGARRGLSFAFLREMQFDDSISVPTCYLNPDMTMPMIPITMNCSVPPIPTPRRAYEVGRTLRDVLHSYPGRERIALVGSGGLSHEPGGPRYFHIDAEFDRWFLGLLAQGDHEKLLAECTLERMEEAGSGGTAELIAWFVVLASTRGPATVLDYLESYAWRCASGWVIWPDVVP
jgi:aromatic ring-opening dioxygenase catalytic subunit (LigB family)